jgi:hypothetical protein
MDKFKSIISNQDGWRLFSPQDVNPVIKGEPRSTPITMENVPYPGIALTPYSAYLTNPGEQYNLRGNTVLEMKLQMGGDSSQQEQLMQVMQMYAQLKGMSVEELMQKVQNLPKEQQQKAIEGMVKEVQAAMQQQEQQPSEEEMPMAMEGGRACIDCEEQFPQAQNLNWFYKAQDGKQVYTPENRAQDSTYYADYAIPANMRKILLGDTFDSYEQIGSAEDYGYNPSVEEMMEHSRNPRKIGYSMARQSAIDAFRNKGAAGKLYLTNDEVAEIAERFKNVDSEGRYTTPNNPMYGSNSYDLKATLSAPDYWRVMQEIKRNKNKKAQGGEAFPQANVYPHMYASGGEAFPQAVNMNAFMGKSSNDFMFQSGGTLYDYVKSMGLDPSFKSRKKLFSKYFNEEYIGSEEQNLYLLKILKAQRNAVKVAATSLSTRINNPELTPEVITSIRDNTFPYANAIYNQYRADMAPPVFGGFHEGSFGGGGAEGSFEYGGTIDIDQAYQIMKRGGMDMNPKKKKGGKFTPESFEEYVMRNGGDLPKHQGPGQSQVDDMNWWQRARYNVKDFFTPGQGTSITTRGPKPSNSYYGMPYDGPDEGRAPSWAGPMTEDQQRQGINQSYYDNGDITFDQSRGDGLPTVTLDKNGNIVNRNQNQQQSQQQSQQPLYGPGSVSDITVRQNQQMNPFGSYMMGRGLTDMFGSRFGALSGLINMTGATLNSPLFGGRSRMSYVDPATGKRVRMKNSAADIAAAGMFGMLPNLQQQQQQQPEGFSTNYGYSIPNAPQIPGDKYKWDPSGKKQAGGTPFKYTTYVGNNFGPLAYSAGVADQLTDNRLEEMREQAYNRSTLNRFPAPAATKTIGNSPAGSINDRGFVPNTVESSWSPGSYLSAPLQNQQYGGNILDQFEDGGVYDMDGMSEEEIRNFVDAIYAAGGSVEYL